MQIPSLVVTQSPLHVSSCEWFLAHGQIDPQNKFKFASDASAFDSHYFTKACFGFNTADSINEGFCVLQV